MPPAWRFAFFVLASAAVFIAVVRFALRQRASPPRWLPLSATTALVVVGGRVFAKYGHNLGLPWWIYYTVPALLTLLLPPLVFRMSGRELLPYLALAWLSAPAIHVAFSLLLGWKEYMPFIPIPSLQELLA